MMVDSALGLGVHVTQKLGISRINVSGVNGTWQGCGERKART